ncbi:MAG TPA: NAD(P)-binding domain-containing protein [Gemmataceae bacterium]|jgi:thioredoxin reductase|nr:NAD(P)-binding domain-containing protein [Gemmataceae bacterium]
MAKAPALKLAILGAGPIGIEAAFYAHKLQWPFTVYERGRVGEFMYRWGHLRLFSPFGSNSTPLGRLALKTAKPHLSLPAEDAILTGREHITNYLAPLAEMLAPNVATETQVLKVSRRDFLKTDLVGDPARAKSPFRLLVRDKQRERIEEADVVLDCTGVYGQHRWAGAGGIPAPGEIQAESQIAYGLDDISGDKKNHYANRTTLVIGCGYSAATTAAALADLSKDNSSTWGTWIARNPVSTPIRRIPSDPLKERDRLAARANNIALRTDDNVDFFGGHVIESIESLGDRGFKVTTRGPQGPKTWEVERIVANVGYSPDTNLTRELQVDEDYATLGPRKLMGSKSFDPLKSAGPDSLRHPEPNFFVLGVKSYGRNPNFLLRVGFEQVRDVFTILAGSSRLDLYRDAK